MRNAVVAFSLFFVLLAYAASAFTVSIEPDNDGNVTIFAKEIKKCDVRSTTAGCANRLTKATAVLEVFDDNRNLVWRSKLIEYKDDAGFEGQLNLGLDNGALVLTPTSVSVIPAADLIKFIGGPCGRFVIQRVYCDRRSSYR